MDFSPFLQVLGLGEKWKGGDMAHPGGGHKINLLKEELASIAEEKEDLIVMFTDAYDVILTADADHILKLYRSFAPARIVFSAEGFCWPDAGLAERYPEVDKGYRFLNSGGFIGRAKDVAEMLTHEPAADTDDDQLYYTKIFLNKDLRRRWSISLDTTAKIFQNLNGAVGDVGLRFRESGAPYLANSEYDTEPVVIHGNGPLGTKVILNSLGNYLPQAWNKEDGCTSCWEDNLNFKELAETPQVVLAVFIEQPTPFMEEFFETLVKLDYPKDKIDLYLHCASEYHDQHVTNFLEAYGENAADGYHSVVYEAAKEKTSETAARDAGLARCAQVRCDYYLSVDSDARLDNPHVLKLLIEQNRGVVAPMLIRPFKAWSNFWGALSSEGFYARSTDYMDIVQGNRQGLWNVPYVSGAYLVQGHLLHDPERRPSFNEPGSDPDMAFMADLRQKGVFIYVSNRLDWGHLVNADEFETKRVHNELWEIASNQYDWERRYLHENYSDSLEEGANFSQPCPDVYWFPVVTDRFADELVEEMEAFGGWSDGSNSVSRCLIAVLVVMGSINGEGRALGGRLRERAHTGHPHEPDRLREGVAALFGHIREATAGGRLRWLLPQGNART